jgi:heme/copper-type cytochrome/quinol oxidase subunit 3
VRRIRRKSLDINRLLAFSPSRHRNCHSPGIQGGSMIFLVSVTVIFAVLAFFYVRRRRARKQSTVTTAQAA